ncbi:MAG: DUF58 domain-containing protein [Kiritimatiellae bacterium]|nr:DUF58 domain-containing protein [Kiritimatiellia bacterium]
MPTGMSKFSAKDRKREPPSASAGIARFLSPEERHKLSRLMLLSRYVVEGNLAGAHRSPLRGPSSEFADHKAYALGDDPKHIDWRVLARTDRFYIKRYDDETNLRVYISLDRSASMNYGSAGLTKFDYACRLAAALGYVVVKSRDSVGLFLHAEKVDVRLGARNSLRHLNDLLKQVQAHPPASGTAVGETLHEIAASVRRRALIVVISDLLGDEKTLHAALARLRKQHHDVIVLHVLDPAEIDLSFKQNCEFIDLETGEKLNVNPRSLAPSYREVFGAFLERHRQACASLRIDYRLVRTDQPLDIFVRAYLQERRKLSK